MSLTTISGAELGPQLWVGTDLSPERFVAPTMDDHSPVLGKPHGGLWTSTHNGIGRSAWVAWCQDNNYRWLKGLQRWVLEPMPDARILEIDSLGDLRQLLATYPYRRFPDIHTLEIIEPNYPEILADGYDAVHLTRRGLNSTRMSLEYIFTAVWDCESTVWLEWVFRHAERRRTRPLRKKRSLQGAPE